MPWTDDHDVIIMNDLKPKFRDEVIPELRRYGFEIWVGAPIGPGELKME